MTKIDFYILPEATERACLLFVCRLVEKATDKKHRIYIHVTSESEAKKINELLWTYSDISFIPHALCTEKSEPAPPVQIGYQKIPDDHADVLINLSQTVPASFKQFQRILEIVPSDTTLQQQAREHYRFYQQSGCQLQSHKL